MQDFRPTLLHHVLELVPFEGWSEYALNEAARQSGISDIELRQVFPDGITACPRYYFEQVDAQMEQQCPAPVLAAMRTPQRIEALIMARLTIMLPQREAVRLAASAKLLPWNAANALHSLYATADNMWRLAGDRVTDFNHYTKRITLAGVYTSTFLCWLNDTSGNLETTRLFLKRRLAEVAGFHKKKKRILGIFSPVASIRT